MVDSGKENEDIQIKSLIAKDYDPKEVAKQALEVQLAADSGELTSQMKVFCEEYVIHYNPPLAAEKAGWNPWSAASIASNLLKNPTIQNKIKELEEQASLNRQITRERVIQELGKIAFVNVQDFYDENGRLKPVQDMDRDVAAAISEIKVERRWEGRGDDRESYDLITVKPESKKGALDSLSKYFGIFERDNKMIIEQGFGDFFKSLPKEVRNDIKLALMKRIGNNKKK